MSDEPDREGTEQAPPTLDTRGLTPGRIFQEDATVDMLALYVWDVATARE